MTTIKKIQTTSDANGYPTNLKNGYIGFETWAEAKKFAEEKDLALMCLSQKAGWQVWHREDSVYEPMTITAADYGVTTALRLTLINTLRVSAKSSKTATQSKKQKKS